MYCLMPGSNARVGMMYFVPLFVLYTNQSRAGCVSPHLQCATFFVVCIKSIVIKKKKPHHVANVRPPGFYMLEVFVSCISND